VPVFPERKLSPLFDLAHALHGLERRLHQLAVVADGDVSPLFEVDCRVLSSSVKRFSDECQGGTHDGHFFARCFAERLCPPHLTGISLHSEKQT
jgi:hypothetical protein